MTSHQVDHLFLSTLRHRHYVFVSSLSRIVHRPQLAVFRRSAQNGATPPINMNR
jgi:hypothetical protein